MMKSVMTCCLSIVFSQAVATESPPKELQQMVDSSYICLFKQMPHAHVAQKAEQAMMNAGAKKRHVFTTAVQGFSAHMSAKAVEKLQQNNSHIQSCEKNGLGQTGAKGGKNDKPGKKIEQFIPENIRLIDVPAYVTTQGRRAWIIDSGIDLGHPDLNINETDGANFDSLSKGKQRNLLDDVTGHGTHVAGILAAIDNDIDVVGVAAGAEVIPVRVLHNSNWAAIDDMVMGIEHVAKNWKTGDVANMSIWAYGHYQSLHMASMHLADKIPFVVIAGNDAEDINERPSEPSHVVHKNLYTVSSVDNKKVFSDISNYGDASQWVDCHNPEDIDFYDCASVDVASYGVDIPSLQPGGGIAYWNGTSMAAPHVAGILLLRKNLRYVGTAINDPDGVADPVASY